MLRLNELEQQNFPYRWRSVTAVSAYLGIDPGRCLFLWTDADIVRLAPLFPDIEFIGIDGFEAVITHGGYRIFVLSEEALLPSSLDHGLISFARDPVTNRYYDPGNVYPLLKKLVRGSALSGVPSGNITGHLSTRESPLAGDTLDPAFRAIMTARFNIVFEPSMTDASPGTAPEDNPPLYRRMILDSVLTGRGADRGLEMLAESGILFSLIPDLAAMQATGHSKEGHPEGDVWRHTLETFRYRKNQNLLVSLALLLHDSGKPFSDENEGRRFDRHAEIGARIARNSLKRLGYSPDTVQSVGWLIRNHMIPGALYRLPPYRRNPIMASPLFPLLLEVYRCDLSSTFRGPDGYYRACTIYRKYLKDASNPFRDEEGKKLVRLYVAGR